MATQREIRKRIKSVSSTKKITSTMEMISTAKMKKMQIRLAMSRPYESNLMRIIYKLKESTSNDLNASLLQEKTNASRVLILVIIGNRGLCGGYNTNVINNTLSLKDKLLDEDKEVLLHVIGKKGGNYFKFMNISMHKFELNQEDKITFNDTRRLGDELIEQFGSGEVDEVYVSYTNLISPTLFKPDIFRLLPISINENHDDVKGLIKKFPTEYIFEPNMQRILTSLLPLYVKIKLYTVLLESGLAEQFSRRVAMKNATDAATDMIKELTIKYNRARQSKITSEIAEIIGGAQALE